jgi:ABC-type glycerol-3-phosphate transport system permease component
MADTLALLSILCLQFFPITPLYLIFHFSVLCSSSCLVIVSSERFIAIRHPLKYREKWNRSTTIKLVVAATVFNILLIASTIVAIEYLNLQSFNQHYFGTFLFVTRIVPFSVILVTNVLMIKGLHDNTKRLIKMSSKGTWKQSICVTRAVLLDPSCRFCSCKNSYKATLCTPFYKIHL